MIIYHALSYYQTLACLVHSCLKTDEHKVFILGGSIAANIHSGQLHNFFQKIIHIDIRAGLGNLQDYEKQVTDYFQKIFSENDITLDENTKIYAGGCHYNFGTYLAVNHIPFYYMEEACGLLSQADHVRNIDRNNRKEIDIIDSLGLYDGSCESIVGVICNITAQNADYSNEKMIHFDVLHQLKQLDETTIQNIIHTFGDVDTVIIPENSVVFLSQHYANLNMMTYERQALLYGFVFDYFLEGRQILMKKHPADNMAYTAVYPDVLEIKESFLSEFIPFIMKPIPKMIATISSTGLIPLRTVSEQQMIFDFAFESVFESLHRIYIALDIASEIDRDAKISCIGINRKMIENLAEYSRFGTNTFTFDDTLKDLINPDTIFIIDSLTIDADNNIENVADYFADICRAKAVLFINSGQDYIFHNSTNDNIWNNIVPIPINKRNQNPDRDYEMYNDFETETIYLYTHSSEVRQMAIHYQQEKNLPHLQIELSVNGYDTKEQLEIAILKGKLEAAEKRLLYYLNLYQEQNKH